MFAIYLERQNSDTMYYVHKDYLGSYQAITDQNGTVWEYRSYGPWGRARDPFTWGFDQAHFNKIFDRGFTGHEHLDAFNLINMNGRVYDPWLGRFLSPDPFVQAPGFSQSYNRYSYAFNNPLKYTDPDGDIAWFVPVLIGAAIYGAGNLAVHAISGDVQNFGDAIKFFGQGALAGALLGASYVFAPMIPGIGSVLQTGMNIYGTIQAGSMALSTLSGLGQGIFSGDWSALRNAGMIFLGNFNIDENRSFLGGLWQGVSRHTWEFFQNEIGHSFAQIRNTFGAVDNVEYFGGITLANRNTQSGDRGGMTLGSFIMGTNLRASLDDWIFLHEFGHVIQSQAWGPIYGLVIASMSGLDMWPGSGRKSWPDNPSYSKHDIRWYEMQANRMAARYFEKYFGVSWDDARNPRWLPPYSVGRHRPSFGTNGLIIYKI